MVGGCRCLNGFRPGNPSSFVTCVTVLAVASFLIPCLAFAQASSAKTETVSINQQLKAPMSRAALMTLLQRRRVLIERLMGEDPASVRSVMLTPSDLARLTASDPAAAAQVEKEGEWSGPLELLAEDDFDHHRSITHWRVRTNNSAVELFFVNGVPSVKPSCLPRIRVSGVGTDKSVAVDSVLAMSNAPPVCSTKGVQHIAVILLTMPSAKTFPSGFDAAYFQQLFFSSSGYTLTNFWEESSYGQTSATGQVFGPFALKKDFNCTDNDKLAAAAIQAASSLDFTQFDRVALIFPVQTCSYGGLGTIGCWETLVPNQNISIAWLPIFPYQDTANYIGAVAHETGHNLGLNHSNTLDSDTVPVGAFDQPGEDTEYGDPFSVMGQVWTQDGSQKILGQYNAKHKGLDLDWLDLSHGDYQEVSGSGSFTMLPFESPGGLRALRILRDPALGGWLWLEYRQPLGLVDSTFSFLSDINEPSTVFDGALVHVESSTLDPLRTYLADFNAVAQPNDFYHAPMTSGRSWSDPYSPLTLAIGTADANGVSATVTYDPVCATLSMSGSPFPSNGGTGSIAVSAPPTCSWTAVTRSDWITLTGGTSGHGNGSVRFTVGTGPGGTAQRNGYVTVQRQSLKVIQAGTGTVIVGASPIFGTGSDAHLTFSFSDPRGYADISSANIDISTLAEPSLASCSMFFNRGSSTVSLLNDAGTQYSNPLNLTVAGGSVANSQCTLSSTGSSISGAGNSLQLGLQLSFAPAFVGSHNVVVSVTDTTGTSNSLQVATWMVPLSNSGSASILLAPSSLDFGNRALGDPSLPSPITLTNGGSGPLIISNISIAGSNAADFVQTNNCGSTVAAGTSCTFQISFAPSADGLRSASLLITDNVAGSPQSASLSGTGGTVPIASITPSTVFFASQVVGTTSVASTVTFSNQGSDVLSITAISMAGNNAADFSQTNNCGTLLAAGTSCNISVVFSPSDVGSRLATLSISDNASGSPHTIGLSGTASDFAVGSSDGSTTATVSAGQTATYHLRLSAENGFSGSVSLACGDAAPYSNCTIPAASNPLLVNGADVPFTVQVSTTGSTTSAGAITFPSSLSMTILLAGLTLAALGRVRHRRWQVGLSTAVVAFCLSTASCGGGGTSSALAQRLTPAGNYQVTVNASNGKVTHPIVLTLKVQ
jgi:hypothetical protein